MKRATALFSAIILIFSCILLFPGCSGSKYVVHPKGKEKKQVYDMPPSGYELVFEDNFDGSELDTGKWYYRGNGERRGGFNAPSQVSVSDGYLHIRQQYLEDGEFGEGWYAGMLGTKDKFERGWFEIRCRCNKTYYGGFWSAFWLQAEHPYDPLLSKGGTGGAEIDVMESSRIMGVPVCSGGIHCAGSEINAENRKNPDDLDSKNAYKKILTDCEEEFHTFTFFWDRENYTFLVDGKKLAVTHWADGVSAVPEEVIVSLELSGKPPEDKEFTSEFTVDYVKIYQLSDDIQIKKPD